MLQQLRENELTPYEAAHTYLNPKLVQVMDILGFNQNYVRAEDCFLYTESGTQYLDFHSGEGFASLGHNNPIIKKRLIEAMEQNLPDGTQIHYSKLSGQLAESLCKKLPPELDAVFFSNSGTETVEAALKFARGASGRSRLLSCEEGYHGLTYGSLSVSSENYFKKGFGPLLPDCDRVPFNDLEALERELRKKDVAAFIVEPIQGRKVSVPDPDYFKEVERLCKKYKTFLIFDEIQTGLGRTGKWFALEHWGIEPDFVLVAKALSGGFIPIGAMITKRKIYNKVVNNLDRCYVQHSTYGRNKLAMIAGLATLEVIETQGLVQHVHDMGEFLFQELKKIQKQNSLIGDIRGLGLMIGLELGKPTGLKNRAEWSFVQRASKGLYPQLVVVPLHRDHQIISMASGHNDVIKFLPPYIIDKKNMKYFVDSLQKVLDQPESSLKLIREIASKVINGSIESATPKKL